jgi:hypothetical protein
MSRSYEHKFDQGKTRWDLLPWECVEQVAEILTYGADKYAAEDWKVVDDAESRYFSALLRHLIAYKQGEDLDNESGKLHLAHMATNALFLLWFNMQKKKFKVDNYVCSICGKVILPNPGELIQVYGSRDIFKSDDPPKYACTECMKGK